MNAPCSGCGLRSCEGWCYHDSPSDYPPEEPRPLPSPESAERPGWPRIAIVDVEVRKTGPNRYRAEAA